MIDILIVFPKLSDGQGIRNLLMRHGYNVIGVYTSGAQAKAMMDELDYGVVVCGYKFNDMVYSDLYEEMDSNFQMMLIASAMKIQEGITDGVVGVEMPLKANDMIEVLEVMISALERLRKKDRKKPRERKLAQKAIINEAKNVLMKNRNMTEEEAHRYIQKNSMDSGNSMVETARMILDLIH
ncbi:response regulator NasT [Lachnospiraceae bacterium RM5]|nr:response regulator NasT [Lachnospiraceae bacterium RM5]